MENPKEALHEIVCLWKIKQAKNLENQDMYRDKFRSLEFINRIGYFIQ